MPRFGRRAQVTVYEFYGEARKSALFSAAAGTAYYLLFCLFPLAFSLRLFTGEADAFLFRVLILRFLPNQVSDTLISELAAMPQEKARAGFFLLVCLYSVLRAYRSVILCVRRFYGGRVPHRKFSERLPGVFLCAVLWSALFLWFAYYIEHFYAVSVLYGSLFCAMVLLLWLYSLSVSLLCGALWNALSYKKARETQTFRA